MADMHSFPLDGMKGARRGVGVIACVLMTLICGAVALYLLLGCVMSFFYEGLWLAFPLLLPMAAGWIWFTGTFILTLERMYTRASVSEEGVTLMRPLRRERLILWDEFQQVCICYSSSVPGRNDGVSVLCFVRHGEKRNLYDRWRTDNPWHSRRLIVADHTAEIEQIVRAVCPMEVVDLRGSIAYPHPEK